MFTVIYYLAVIFTVLSFPFHKNPETNFTPPVTLLKPVRGIEPETYINLKSFFTQEYPSYQILFGISSKDDPVIQIIEKLHKEFPHLNSKIVFVKEELGSNQKVNSLCAMFPFSEHEFLVISDSDIRVESHYLKSVMASFVDPKIGMVTCPYRVESSTSIPETLELYAVNMDFIPSVFVAHRLSKIRFGLGATMAVRREALDNIGGFKVLASYLADDYQLGFRIANKGWKVHLSGHIVKLILPLMTFCDFFVQQLRWARTYRVSRPAGYFFSILTNWLPFAAGLLFLTKGDWWSIIMAVGAFFFRLCAAYVSHKKIATKAHLPIMFILVSIAGILVKDFINFILWMLAFSGNTVEWQGQKYHLASNGTMHE